MTLTRDECFEFRGLHDCKSVCRLRIYEQDDYCPVVIVTELEDNPGTCIVNWSERLMTAVWKMLERPVTGLIWIEHQQERPGIAGKYNLREYFARVTFQPLTDSFGVTVGFCEPHWQPMSKENVEALLGQHLKPTLIPA